MKSRLFVKIIIIILISLSIGLIYIYPDLRFRYELKTDFKGIALTAAADELGYLARIKAVYKGNFTCRSIDIYEHRSEPWLQPFLSELIEGSFGRLFNINVVSLDVLMSFLLPIILFWLIFLFLKNLCGSRVCSFFGSALILLGYDLFTLRCPDVFKEIFIGQSYSQPLWFLRPISPQINHVVFISALLMFYISINKKNVFFAGLAAIFSGALFYIHPHYWVFIYTGVAVFTLFLAASKDRRALKLIFYFIFLSLLVSIPFWVHIYKLKFDPNFSSALSFTGLVHIHRPILPLFHVALTIIIIVLLGYLQDPNLLFLSSFLIGGILCLNQQLITGVTLVPGHWQGYTNKTFIMIALTASLFKAIRIFFGKKVSVWRFATMVKRGILISAVLFLYITAFAQQNSYYQNNKARAEDRQAIAGVYKWLNHNARDTDVILADPFNYLLRKSPYTFEILTYTNCYIYLPSGCTSLASRQEQEDRFLYAFNLFDYPPQKVESFLRYANGAFFVGIEALPEYGGKPLAAEEIQRIKAIYLSLKHLDKIEVMKKYRLNYIIIDSSDLPKYNKKISPTQLKTVYTDSNFCIIKVL